MIPKNIQLTPANIKANRFPYFIFSNQLLEVILKFWINQKMHSNDEATFYKRLKLGLNNKNVNNSLSNRYMYIS